MRTGCEYEVMKQRQNGNWCATEKGERISGYIARILITVSYFARYTFMFKTSTFFDKERINAR